MHAPFKEELTMYAFMYVLAAIAVLAILLWTVDKAHARSGKADCPHCATRIPAAAFVCPNCQRDLP